MKLGLLKRSRRLRYTTISRASFVASYGKEIIIKNLVEMWDLRKMRSWRSGDNYVEGRRECDVRRIKGTFIIQFKSFTATEFNKAFWGLQLREIYS
jgi:hypothetical protein